MIKKVFRVMAFIIAIVWVVSLLALDMNTASVVALFGLSGIWLAAYLYLTGWVH